jgi:predicted ATP-dependent serine protease
MKEMHSFRCPYCGKHTNKWISKCPDCGFERILGKGVKVENEDIKYNRGSSRERMQLRNRFIGGRNQSLVGESHKRHSTGRDMADRRAYSRRGTKQN